MNDFCLYCTNGDRKEVYECGFRACPFYRYRWYNLGWQMKKRYKSQQRNLLQGKKLGDQDNVRK